MLVKKWLGGLAIILVCAGLISCGGGDNLKPDSTWQEDAVYENASSGSESVQPNNGNYDVNNEPHFDRVLQDYRAVFEKMTTETKRSTKEIIQALEAQAVVDEIKSLTQLFKVIYTDFAKTYQNVVFSDEENQRVSEMTATAIDEYMEAMTEWGYAIGSKILDFPDDEEIIQGAMDEFQREIDELVN